MTVPVAQPWIGGPARRRWLPPFGARRLRDGRWVVVTDSEIICLDDITMSVLRDIDVDDGVRHTSRGGAVLAALDELDLLQEDADASTGVEQSPSEHVPLHGRRARVVLWAVLAAGSAACLVALYDKGPLTGQDLVPPALSPPGAVASITAVAVVTSIPHELLHVVVGRRAGEPPPRVRVRAGTAVASTSLTHTWLWNRPAQLAAIAAGLAADVAILASLLWLADMTDWLPRLCASVVAARILWQAGMHRRCDGALALSAVMDDPTLRTDTVSVLRGRARPCSRHIVGIAAAVVGVGVDAFLATVWARPVLRNLRKWITQ